jgi:hypothetical protein
MKKTAMAEATNKHRPWTKEDVQMLKTLVREKTKTSVVARKLERTEDATRQKASRLGIKLAGAQRKRKPWPTPGRPAIACACPEWVWLDRHYSEPEFELLRLRKQSRGVRRLQPGRETGGRPGRGRPPREAWRVAALQAVRPYGRRAGVDRNFRGRWHPTDALLTRDDVVCRTSDQFQKEPAGMPAPTRPTSS